MSEAVTTVDYIDHKAIIDRIDSGAGQLTLRLSTIPECEGCAAARLCNPSGEQTTTFVVKVPNVKSYRVGETVTLRGTEQLHHKAILIATVIPSIALIVVMIVIYYMTGSEGAAASAGLGSMLLFFLLLYLSRNRLAHEFSFEVIPSDKQDQTQQSDNSDNSDKY
ncbi:MAG: SoxR reducing system RseC family protein [Muribaculaceae bacterium]|nr:SoxR reducing system RseC family protein [Muribaculaceae bacterium]